MKRSAIAATALFIALAQPMPLLAVDAHHQGGQAAGQELADGEVRKVDKDAKKITLRHGPIKSLDMPAMTMVFQVKESAMLDQVKVGDKIRFSADKTGGAYTITKMEPAK
ncbi:MAG: copper-binding protein [Betaproteobacteria bacterium]